MPVIGFLCNKTGQKIQFVDAPAHFEQMGVMPAEATAAVIEQENDPARRGPYLSGSILHPSMNCRREILLKKYFNYNMEPLVSWDALEGTLWHELLAAKGEDLKDGHYRELRLPDVQHAQHARVKENEHVPGHYLYELFPDVWISGKLDHLDPIEGILKDTKTTKYPWTRSPTADPMDYGPRNAANEWPVQLSAYAHMAEDLMGIEVKTLKVWRMYRGSRNRAFTWKEFEVEKWSKERLWSLIEEHVTSATSWLQSAQEIVDNERNAEQQIRKLEALVVETPMDGKKMFNGKKCPLYCSVRPLCYQLAGEIDF